MPVPIQHGGVADQLRRFLRLVGRAGTAMDETIVPSVNVQNLGQPPWRSGTQDFAIAFSVAAVAARFGVLGVYLRPTVRGVAVIDQLIIRGATATQLPFVASPIDQPDIGIIQNYIEAPSVNVENWDLPSDIQIPHLPPIAFGGTSAAVPTNDLIGFYRTASNGQAIIPLRVCIRGHTAEDRAVYRGLGVTCATANQAIEMTFSGTWYPDAE